MDTGVVVATLSTATGVRFILALQGFGELRAGLARSGRGWRWADRALEDIFIVNSETQKHNKKSLYSFIDALMDSIFS